MKEPSLSYGCVALSIAVHGSILLGRSQPHAAARRPELMELQLAPPPPVVPPAAPAPAPALPQPDPKPRPAPNVAAHPHVVQPSPRSLDAESPVPAPEPELTGRTLTTSADASWSAPGGNGEARATALGFGSGAPRLLPVASSSRAPLPPPPQATQPLAQLSRKPAPPSLAAALERNFPADARRQGRSGDARVRALIDARGRATSVTVTSESGPGFGAACQKTLLQSQWTPPLGARGEPIGTFVSYRCRFQVND